VCIPRSVGVAPILWDARRTMVVGTVLTKCSSSPSARWFWGGKPSKDSVGFPVLCRAWWQTDWQSVGLGQR
jgi:hypothetical protein